jgi:Type I phosphodiesterase / nucleotide pyrophosphatase
MLFDPAAGRERWYERADDLRAPALWDWARQAGRTTAAVSWPSTVGAPIDLLLPERDYYLRGDPVKELRDASTPGLFERLGVAPSPEAMKDARRWDEMLTAVAAAMLRQVRPHLLLLHLIELDFVQHGGGRDAADLAAAVARVDGHVATLVRAVADAGLADRTAIVVTGDHGFQDVAQQVAPNEILARAGLRGCPRAGDAWRAAVHGAGGGAGVFVNPPGDVAAAAAAEQALRREAGGAFTVLSRRELDDLGAMPGAAFGLEVAPGYGYSGACRGPLVRAGRGGTHGFLPTRPAMATGFIAHGAGVKPGVVIERVRLVDVAPTVARLLGLATPPMEGRVLAEILE